MQNRYTADVGDFGKYALLNALTGTDLRLGVMWYLNTAEESNTDGGFTDYAELKPCDQALYEKLVHILRNSTRSLSEVEAREIFPSGALFYRAPLPFPRRPCFTATARTQQEKLRQEWLSEGLEKLRTANLLFLDPDNGVAGRRVKKYSRKSVKYAFLDEIPCWLQRHQSVVVYQHQRRQPLEKQISGQLREFGECGTSGWAISFHRRGVRIFFVLPVPEHREQLRKRTMAFAGSRWCKDGHFRLQLGTQ